jgi:hypothetical protein
VPAHCIAIGHYCFIHFLSIADTRCQVKCVVDTTALNKDCVRFRNIDFQPHRSQNLFTQTVLKLIRFQLKNI